LKKNPEKIDWFGILLNPHPEVSGILEQNQEKIDWFWLSSNPCIFELDLDALKERCAIFKEELIQRSMHPSRIQRLLDMGYEIEDLEELM